MKGLAAFILLICAVGGVLWAAGVLPTGESGEAGEIQPVKTAASRAEALKLAKEEDLPAIAQADKVVIKQIDIVRSKRRQITVESKTALEQIHDALTIAQQREDAASTRVYTLNFYRDGNLIRTVYVHWNNEWGIDRPGGRGNYWYIGKNDQLPALLNKLLQPAGWTD